MTDEPKLNPHDLSAFEAPRASAGFADQVIARVGSPPRRTVRRWAVPALLAVVVSAVWVVERSSRAEPTTGARVTLTRETLSVGRAVVVAEAGTSLRWSVGERSAELEQANGKAFYRVEAGGAFTVRTPAGPVSVTGTCFEIEVVPMAWSKTQKRSAAALAGLAVTVAVLEGQAHWGAGSKAPDTVLNAGERLTRQVGSTPDDLLVGATSAAGAASERPSLVGVVKVKGSGEVVPLAELTAVALLTVSDEQRLPRPDDPRTLADPRGAFRFGALERGRWQLQAWAPGYGLATRRVNLPTTAPLTLELEAAGVLEGFVRNPDGTPAARAQVTAFGRGAPRLTQTGAGGGFSIEVPAGAYLLTGRLGERVGARPTQVGVRAGATVKDLVIVLGPGGWLTGTVADVSRHRPIVGATISVSPANRHGLERTAVTQHDGRYTLGPLPPGSYDVEVEATGFTEARKGGLEVTADQRFTIDFLLAGHGRVQGVVRDDRGVPVGGVAVRSRAWWAREPPLQTISEADGHFELRDVPVGKRELFAQRADEAPGPVARVDLREGATAEVTLTLPSSGRVIGSLTALAGTLPPATFAVRYDNLLDHHVRASIAPVEADGTFALTLPAGSYAFEAFADEVPARFASAPKTATVAVGGVTQLELALEPRAFVALRVVEPDQTPSRRAWVTVLPEGKQPEFHVTDDEGRLFLPPLPAGQPCRVHASNLGRAVDDTFDGASQAEVVVRLRPGATLKGRVLSRLGRPVEQLSATLSTTDPVRLVDDSEFTFAGDHFEFPDFPAQHVTLHVQTPDGQAGDATVELHEGEARTLEVVVAPKASITGRVRLPSSAALAWVMIDGDDHGTMVGADGSFDVGVAAGVHQVRVLASSGAQFDREVTVTDGHTAELGEVALTLKDAGP